MGFGKAFGAGIGIFIGFNVLIYFLGIVLLGIDPIYSAAYGDIATQFQAFILSIQTMPIETIFGILSGGGATLISMGITLTTIPGYIFVGAYFALLVPIITIVLYIVAAVIIGYLAHSPFEGFGAWFLVNAIGVVLGLLITGITAPFTLIFSLMLAIPALIVNGLAYGVIAMGNGYKYEE